MGKEQLEELEKYGKYLSVPHGISMWPMIRNSKDIVEIRKIEKPPVRYDLVMYVRPDSQGVIHRVLHPGEDIYIINGDNCWQKERVKPEQIKGIVTRFCRKGKWHDVTEKKYLIYVHLMADLFFIRRPIYYVRDRIKYRRRKKK